MAQGLLAGSRVSIPVKSLLVSTTRADVRSIAGAHAKPGGAGYEVVSASAADASAGTGARTVVVAELTTAGAIRYRTVTMNGTTAVASGVSDVEDIPGAWVGTAGSGLVNAGAITIRGVSAGTTYAQILAAENSLSPCKFQVPANTVFVPDLVELESVNDDVIELWLMADMNPETGALNAGVYQAIASMICGRGAPGVWTPIGNEVVVPAGATLKLQAKSTTGTCSIAGAIHGAIVPV